ncbi:MAG: ABC transporter permease [Gemmatimonadota bacterium]|jgi:putative ABC transport system permease protein
MSTEQRELWLRGLTRVLLRLYPSRFRDRFGPELEDTYAQRMEGRRREGSLFPFLRTCGLLIWHSVRDGTLERMGSRVGKARAGTPRGMLEEVGYDVRYALRGMRKRPAFYALVLLVFALGIGANTVMFSVVNGVLLKPLPFPNSHELVVPWQTIPSWLESDNPDLRATWDHLSMAYPVFEDWKEMSPSLEKLGIYARRTYIATGGERPERISGAMASWEFFHVLGIAPALGRTFLETEDRMGGGRLAVLGHGVWQDRFGSSPDVVGQTLILNDVPHTVVGVMPPGFSYPEDTRVWVTLFDSDRERARTNQFAVAIARLKPGVTVEAAQRDMEVVQAQLAELYPESGHGQGYGVNVVSLQEELVGDSRSALLLLLGAVAIFLAIACANIMNLLLLRASERRQELAVRQSLGAGRKRLLGQLLTEGLVLSIMGGCLGLLLAASTLDPFLTLLPAGTPRLDEVSLDGGVLGFSLSLAVLTGILASLIPGLLASGSGLSVILKDAGRSTSGGKGRNRTQLVLLVSEVALTFVLLVGAGLLARSFNRLTSVDTGFSSQGIIAMRVDFRGARYASSDQIRQAYDELTQRLDVMPGTSDVALATPGPFRDWGSNSTMVETRRGIEHTNTKQEHVEPEYFPFMGVPLLSGRTFTLAEMEGDAAVILVNKALEDAFWPEEGAVGQRVKLGRDPTNENPWLTIIGVVGDVRRRLDGEPYTTLFHPVSYGPYEKPTILMKASGDLSLTMAGAREVLRSVDPDVPVISLESLDTEIARTVAGPRVRVMLLSAFSLFAALLAILGIFGLLAQAVTQRRNEIGIRMALGAQEGMVLREVLWKGVTVLLLGLATGIMVTLATVRVLEPFLFQIEPLDVGTMVMVGALLSASALAASFLPARRATRVDPVEALRSD